jgi:sec-independent protein translocase protein TatA
MPGPSEWVIIAIVAFVVLFGAKKIPEMARSLGRAQSEFKKGMNEGEAEGDEQKDERPPTSEPPKAETPE